MVLCEFIAVFFFFFFSLVIHKTKQNKQTKHALKTSLKIVKIRPTLLVPARTGEHTS